MYVPAGMEELDVRARVSTPRLRRGCKILTRLHDAASAVVVASASRAVSARSNGISRSTSTTTSSTTWSVG